ncbi:AraC family transcriptional regulator [Actinophytocola sediminis]
MDVLSDVLAVMRTGRPVAARSSSRAPWGVRFDAGDAAGAHVVLEGGCWLFPGGADPIQLGVGDVVFTPHGDGHALADQPDRPLVDWRPEPTEESPVEEMRIAGTGAVTELLCASYSFDQVRRHPLLDDLPAVIHLPARVGAHPSLRSAVELLGDELRAPRAGTSAALPALIDMLLLYVLRAWLDEQPASTGWAGALHDQALSAALRAIHRHPETQWTVESLARTAGMSRAAFAKRFTTTLRQPPLAYLTWWRLTTAARLLRESDLPLRTVAARCGYGSEFAIAKAFKRAFGVAPGQYRRAGQ